MVTMIFQTYKTNQDSLIPDYKALSNTEEIGDSLTRNIVKAMRDEISPIKYAKQIEILIYYIKKEQDVKHKWEKGESAVDYFT